MLRATQNEGGTPFLNPVCSRINIQIYITISDNIYKAKKVVEKNVRLVARKVEVLAVPAENEMKPYVGEGTIQMIYLLFLPQVLHQLAEI